MNILVTGATGYIGYELVKKLQNIYSITVVIRKESNIKKLQNLKCEIFLYQKYNHIEKLFRLKRFEGVIHCASNVIVEHSSSDIPGLIESNILFGTFLLEACKENRVKWFINTGTFWQNYQNSMYSPVNLYAATKEAFEKIAQYFTETSSLVFTTIKLNDTFGPNDTRGKIFNLWKKIADTGETLKMSYGEQIIDISYIEDVLNAYIQLIELLKIDATAYNNQTFVVTNNERVTLRNLADIFQKITKTKLHIEWGSRAYRKREVLLPFKQGKVVPGWKQKYTLEEAIAKTLKEIII